MTLASIIGPYSSLALQVAAFVAAGGVLALLVRGVRPGAAIPTAAAFVLVFVAANQLRSGSQSFETVRASLVPAPGVGKNELCFVEGQHPEMIAFARWIRARTPSDARIAYVTRSFDRPCMQYALLPRLMVGDAHEADYVMYLDPLDVEDRERLVDERKSGSGDIEFYSAQWALEKRG